MTWPARLVTAAAFVAAFARARWRWRRGTRAGLLAWQRRRLRAFVRTGLAAHPFYAALQRASVDASPGASPDALLHDLPVVDKAVMLARFAQMNRHGIDLAQAMDEARAAEQSRDFRPMLPGGVTVGLSSGTSGRPSVFLVDAGERARWAGAILGKLLRPGELARLANPFAPRLRIAFFLRANSNLYTAIDGARIRFRFFDLLRPLPLLLDELQAFAPDVLVAPASVLGAIARASAAGQPALRPAHVISVAETLEPDDRQAIEAAWGRAPDQVYQATEGLLGSSCAAGRIHLNEEFLHIEPQWLDARRFVPVVTDFSRSSQAVVRYRLDDVLVAAEGDCPCGRPTRSLVAIEGRCDDVLWLPALAGGSPLPVYPDLVRRAMALGLAGSPGFTDYRLLQHGEELTLRLQGHGATEPIAEALDTLWHQAGVRPPRLRRQPWADDAAGVKRRRIRRAGPPPDAESLAAPPFLTPSPA